MREVTVAWRVMTLMWALLGTVGAAIVLTGGDIDRTTAIEGVAGLVALLALWMVVRHPWDLYFAARGVERTQADSVGRAIEVPAVERGEARQLAQRLLAVALGLHLLGAAVCAAIGWWSDGTVGFVAAGAFVVTMGLRPATAMVAHVRQRLGELRGRAVVPRPDARALDDRLRAIEHVVEGVLERIDALEPLPEALDGLGRTLDRRLTAQEHGFRKDMDRVCLEFERSIEKVSSDRELLAGIRAFLALVRQG
jgi:hypothetical protein